MLAADGLEYCELRDEVGCLMDEYASFLAEKDRSLPPVGFDPADLSDRLFGFQKAITRWAIWRGRAAIFADTGLGKTAMQCEWARQVADHASDRVLILAPLAVAHQTVREARKFGIDVHYVRAQEDADRICTMGSPGVCVTNYEMMDRFEVGAFAGVVLDESSILKNYAGKTRTGIIDACQSVPFRLSCTATPSPNDLMELANQSEFLGVMRRSEMLSTFFTHDSGNTSKWRLKGHGRSEFWKWMATWAVVARKPSDLGFANDGYDLPPLRIHEHVVTTAQMISDELFPRAAASLSEQRQAQRESIEDRVRATADLVNRGGTWIVWCHLNRESELLAGLIDGAVAVSGSDTVEQKESALERFSLGETRVLVTKPSICGHGMNWQHCRNVAFVGLSHSFEQFYQSIRRCWRYGQTDPVDAHLFTASSEGQVLASIKRKERQHREMGDEMMEYVAELNRSDMSGTSRSTADYCRDVAEGDGWALHLGDCVDVARDLESSTVDYTLFSPPFASLYTYSASDRDMGNCADDETFARHFRYLIPELFRITKPGRLLSFHCMNLPTSKQHHGYIGVRDFRGELIRAFVDEGWIFHSEVCIWKDPVTAMQRTKALGLLYKQLRKDSAMSRQGIPDYLVTMRKPGENPDPVTKTHESFPVERWQRYASPVWMDINASRVLGYREGRENDDERHICPLQLDVIERAIELWTNPGDLVLSPFAGVGSEGYVSIQMNRRFVGCELKPSYWQLAQTHLRHARAGSGDLFA